jgi:hypothetical protein
MVRAAVAVVVVKERRERTERRGVSILVKAVEVEPGVMVVN